jgi:ABC-type bacteriocin/lantibiotic exporter with double-glycine peptidase domain
MIKEAYIRLPHYEQSASGYCLPACARMILTKMGLTYSELKLSQMLGTDEVGTPSFAVTNLSQLRLDVDYRIWSTAQLAVTLAHNYPVIAFVQAQFLDHWKVATSHAVVFVGMEIKQRFWIHDPILPTGPTAVSWDGMLAAWFEFAYHGATLQRKKRFSFLDWVRKVVARD